MIDRLIYILGGALAAAFVSMNVLADVVVIFVLACVIVLVFA